MNRVQKRFLQSIGVTELEALADYKLAPLSARRDVAMRGLLLRVSHGLSFFGAARGGGPPTRASEVRHRRQLAEFGVLGGHTDVLKKSRFGLATV